MTQDQLDSVTLQRWLRVPSTRKCSNCAAYRGGKCADTYVTLLFGADGERRDRMTMRPNESCLDWRAK